VPSGKATYVGTFRPVVQGVYRVKVMLGSRIVPSTPFSILVIPAAAAGAGQEEASLRKGSVVEASGTERSAGTLLLRDCSGAEHQHQHHQHGGSSGLSSGLHHGDDVAHVPLTGPATPSLRFRDALDPDAEAVNWLGNTTDRVEALCAKVACIRELCTRVDDRVVEAQSEQMQLTRLLKATLLSVKKSRWHAANKGV
jgi:hypothetical protein